MKLKTQCLNLAKWIKRKEQWDEISLVDFIAEEKPWTFSFSTQLSVVYVHHLISTTDKQMFTIKLAGNICSDHAAKIQQKKSSGSSPLPKGTFPIINIEWLEGMRSPVISDGVNNLKITAAANDVINWKFLGISKQHQSFHD